MAVAVPTGTSSANPLATLVVPLRLFASPVSDLPGLGLYRVDCQVHLDSLLLFDGARVLACDVAGEKTPGPPSAAPASPPCGSGAPTATPARAAGPLAAAAPRAAWADGPQPLRQPGPQQPRH